MNRFNKNIFHRTICIFLLLTLCTGLCFEATALPVTMVSGKYYDLGDGYSIRAAQIDIEAEKAWFMLHKEGREVDSEVVADGHLLDFNDGDVFHFDASVHVVARSTVELSHCNCWGLCFEEYASGGDGKKTLAVGEDWELARGYSIRAVTINLEGGKAEFALNKEGMVVDRRDYVRGNEHFSLDDGEHFYFEATVDAVFRGTDANIVQLKPFSWRWWMAVGEPHDLQASTGAGYVGLVWDVPDADCGYPITGYRIYRGTSSGDESYLASVDAPEISYNDTAFTNGQTYHYYVTAVNDAGESSPSSEVSAKPPGRPGPPLSLEAAGGDGYVELSWDAPDDDGGSAITGYNIYSGTTSGGEAPLTAVGNLLTYTDSDVINNQTYYYQVSAVNIADEGIKSNGAEATPKKKPIDWLLIVALITAAATIVAVIYNYSISRHGSISATSRPDGARVFLDGVDKGESPVTLDKIRKGTHSILFSKSGYSDCEKRVVVNADQITSVHCDLKKPEKKLRLSAEPNEIPADGKSKSVITISVEDEEGTPAPAPEDTEIVLETDIGLIDTPVSIPAGDTQATSILTSSTAGGTATVRAKSGTGLKGSVAVRFV